MELSNFTFDYKSGIFTAKEITDWCINQHFVGQYKYMWLILVSTIILCLGFFLKKYKHEYIVEINHYKMDLIQEAISFSLYLNLIFVIIWLIQNDIWNLPIIKEWLFK